jgi:hypothetical protein
MILLQCLIQIICKNFIKYAIHIKIFNEKGSKSYDYIWEARADAIAETIYGKTYKQIVLNEFENDYAVNSEFIMKDIDKIIYDYYLAEKFGADEWVLQNIKEVLAYNICPVECDYVQGKFIGFESEWNIQEYLIRGKK